MGIFEDYEHVEKIGSIRSCRDYFVFLANEYDCIYCHFGQATPYVGDYLNSDGVDNISGAVSGIERPATNTFYRVSERKAPHNVYCLRILKSLVTGLHSGRYILQSSHTLKTAMTLTKMIRQPPFYIPEERKPEKQTVSLQSSQDSSITRKMESITDSSMAASILMK